MLNFNHVYYFHVAATEGSVKGAAEHLGVSQPTVSEQVKALERTLRTTLFERTGTGLRLTDAGKQAFEHTTAMFRAGERLVEVLGHAPGPSPVKLRVGVSAAISRTVAADFLMPVLTVPDCRPAVRTGDSLDLLRDLRSHELDLIINDTEPMDAAQRGLDIIALHQPVLVAITSPGLTPRESWQNISLLEYRPGSAYRWEVDTYLQEKGLRPNGMAELDDAFLMLEAVARGGFVAFVPRTVARDAVTSGRVKVLDTLAPGSAAVFAMYRSGETNDIARRAVELLAEHARTNFSA